MRACFPIVLTLATLTAASATAQTPLGTAFTYQGRLEDNGQPANGPYDLRFILFDAPASGTALDPQLVMPNVAVASGLFTVSLDFGTLGPVFTGDARWLEIAVRPGGSSGAFTVLAPRQELTPSPNAIFASSAADAGRLGGQPPASYQLRITGTCAPGQAIRLVNANGTVVCESAGSGTVTAVTGGAGLTGGTITTSGTLAIDFGGGGAATTAARSDHLHFGQTWTGAGAGLRVQSTTFDGLQGVSSATSGGSGVLGEASSPNGAGVFGLSTSIGGPTSGVFGLAQSTNGRGVTGRATATTGPATGVYGESLSSQGIAIIGTNAQPGGSAISGEALATSGNAFGVRGLSAGSAGIGVTGHAQSPIGPAVGVAGRSDSANGIGVRGIAAATSGFSFGVAGSSSSTTGTGVTGSAGSTSGQAWGVTGFSQSPQGGGVLGESLPTTGTGIGVWGVAVSSGGYGGYFENAGGGAALGVNAGGIRFDDGTIQTTAAAASAGDITAVIAGTGLSGGGTSGDVTLAANPAAVQSRVTGTCGAGSSIRTVNQDGSVVCEPDDDTTGWGLAGNAGTNPATNFIGTTDNQAFEVRVNGARALRLEPNATSPNVVGGFSGNSVVPGVTGAVIGGGGAPTLPNGVTGQNGVVGGGADNEAGAFGTVGGGVENAATSGYSTVGGGNRNKAETFFATVGGGQVNVASGFNATVPGGAGNEAGGTSSLAAGALAKVRNPTQSGDSNGDEGTFVWADDQGTPFTSSAPNQFLIRAGGGVGINTNAPGGNALAVNGNSAVTGNLGVGTSAPQARLHVTGGSVYIAAPNSLVITSPNGNCWFITVSDTGALGSFQVACP